MWHLIKFLLDVTQNQFMQMPKNWDYELHKARNSKKTHRTSHENCTACNNCKKKTVTWEWSSSMFYWWDEWLKWKTQCEVSRQFFTLVVSICHTCHSGQRNNPSRNLQKVPSHAKVWCGKISTMVGVLIIFPIVDTVKYLEDLKWLSMANHLRTLLNSF
jgi:hypothetical protein